MAQAIQIPLQVRFGDIDAYNHVNNVVYLQYLEDARVRLIRTPFAEDVPPGSAASFNDLITDDLFTLVGRNEIEYLAPIAFRTDPVLVNIWVTNVGGSSFDFGYTITDADTSVVFAQAATSMVLVSRATGRPVRLTGAQRAALETWRGGPVHFRRRPAELPAGVELPATPATQGAR
ncbi:MULTISPECIES: thioesterase family protein [unclassified Arthrobacter]|uniref:acyl-CoA thioesterase n=1 Tax=unclassified Arthrobacter TaxID=235627 RepID=UPI00159D8BAA|nr:MULTISPECIES: thioesterase family protein [unclassified Arthrobacter]MCQ9163902.1 acyl-CoA thioesterase [Arthrobacter sp. STN4]NVM98435.1 acyl-CoA thioesterase [Arthrobacter sp. SDTb3-6]